MGFSSTFVLKKIPYLQVLVNHSCGLGVAERCDVTSTAEESCWEALQDEMLSILQPVCEQEMCVCVSERDMLQTLSSNKILGGIEGSQWRCGIFEEFHLHAELLCLVNVVLPPGLKTWIPGIGSRPGVCSDWLLMTDIPLHACPIF